VNTSGVPEPWGTILSLITGPYGVVVVEAVVIYFLYKLYREATGEAKVSQANVGLLTTTINALASSVREWREREWTEQQKFYAKWDEQADRLTSFIERIDTRDRIEDRR
jgi:hypothetical protein